MPNITITGVSNPISTHEVPFPPKTARLVVEGCARHILPKFALVGCSTSTAVNDKPSNCFSCALGLYEVCISAIGRSIMHMPTTHSTRTHKWMRLLQIVQPNTYAAPLSSSLAEQYLQTISQHNSYCIGMAEAELVRPKVVLKKA